MTALESDYETVPSTATAIAIDPYMGTLQYEASTDDNQNKSILLGMTIQMLLLEERVKI